MGRGDGRSKAFVGTDFVAAIEWKTKRVLVNCPLLIDLYLHLDESTLVWVEYRSLANEYATQLKTVFVLVVSGMLGEYPIVNKIRNTIYDDTYV